MKHTDPPANGDWGSGWQIRGYGPDGHYLKTIVHHVLGRAMLGPRVDPMGNVYIAEAIHPP